MVTTIGFRATPTDVRFAVFDGDQRSVVNIEILRIPTAFSGPEGLKFIRSNVLDILREYEVAYAGNPADRFQSAIEVSNELAQIDEEYLDWRYAKEDDCQVWKKNVRGTEYEFTVQADGATEMTKTVNGGETRRVRKFCTDGMTKREIRTALGEEP